MQKKLDKLKQLLNEMYNLSGIIALLGWDQETYMPTLGADDRGYQLETVSRILHQKGTSDELGGLLEELSAYAKQLSSNSNDACLIRKAQRKMEKDQKVPTEWVAEFARLTTTAQTVWHKARQESSFSQFEPYLKRVVEMRRSYSSFFAPYQHIYDPQIDDFEEGMKTADVMAVFYVIRPRQVDLIRKITQQPVIDDQFLHQNFEEQKQWDFGVDVLTQIGFDWKRGRQDRSAHPFTNTIGLDDVRITTRFLTRYLPSSLFSSVHEMGHALYELGFDRSLDRTLLSTGASMGVHESQSRLWENLVARSLPFWKYFYPKLQSYFPAQLGNVDVNTFYRGINKVKPSLIRVESDEATYNLHIMLRLELEIAMLDGSIEIHDLPDAWNEKMQNYLGLTPPNDAQGLLQDVHWSFGGIGYFPTYALGNIISAQIWQKVKTDLPNLDEEIEKGNFHVLLDWLRENIHRRGAKFESQELIKKVTGRIIDPQPYLQYLEGKYKNIYQI